MDLKSVGETHLAAAHTGICVAKIFIADLAPGPILSWHRVHLFSEIIVTVASQLGVKNVIYMSILGRTVSAVFDLLCQFGAVACIYSDEE